jgi:xanthine dehydrogenase accessory factor
MPARPSVVVRGGGEMATAAARLLFLAGFPVVVLERAQPLAVRRLVSFAEAVFSDEVEVEGVLGRRVPLAEARFDGGRFVPVAVDPDGAALARLAPGVLVDGRMAKVNLGTARDQAAFVVGVGPGFVAGEDVHAVVETQRGSDLGRVLWTGSAEPDTAVPAEVKGFAARRVLRAPRSGIFRAYRAIGDVVLPRQKVGEVDGEPVVTPIAGLVRGLLADGVSIESSTKVGDVDPRGPSVDPRRMSDKGRAVAAGVLEAILIGRG